MDCFLLISNLFRQKTHISFDIKFQPLKLEFKYSTNYYQLLEFQNQLDPVSILKRHWIGIDKVCLLTLKKFNPALLFRVEMIRRLY